MNFNINFGNNGQNDHDQDTILFCIKSQSFDYRKSSQQNNNTYNPQKLFLVSTFPIFEVIPRSFTISTKSSKCNFNLEMLKETSPTISEFVSKNPNETNYFLNINDEEKVLFKFEQLYQGQTVTFDEDEISVSQRITRLLQIKNCPNFLKPQSLYVDNEYDSNGNKYYFKNKSENTVVICLKFFVNYLKSEQLQTFKIITKQKEYNCNIFGIYSSNVIKKFLQNDPTINKFEFDFKDESNEFQSISNFFNFIEVDITSDNMYSLKEIAESLEIEIIINQINVFIYNYEKNAQKINEQQTIVDSIDHLFDLLYNVNSIGIQKVKMLIVQSKWSQEEEEVHELAAFILQVVKSSFCLQKEMASLLILLNEEANESNKLSILIPFIVNHLLNFYMKNPIPEKKLNNSNNDYNNNFDIDDSNDPNNKCIFGFIRLLYKREIIPKEKIIEKLSIYNCQNQTLNAFFLPELCEINPKNINAITLKPAEQNSRDSGFIKKNDDFSLFIEKYLPDKIELYKRMIDNMEPDDELTKSLRDDDIDKLQFIVNNSEIDIIKTFVPYNIFDCYEIKLNLINYAALYGSIKCFKFLLLNHAKIDKTTLYFAVSGGNTEIIKISDDKCPKIDDDDNEEEKKTVNSLLFDYGSDDSIIISAITMHRNDIFDWLFEKKYLNKNNLGNKLNDIALIAAKNGNIHSLIQIADKGIDISSQNIINCAAHNGFYKLTSLLLNMNHTRIVQQKSAYDSVSKYYESLQSLQSFVHFGNLSLFKLIIIETTSQWHLQSTILYAIKFNYKNIINFFFDNRNEKKITFEIDFINSLLSEAIKNKKDELFNYLLKEFKEKEPIIFTLDFYTDLLNKACLNSNLPVTKEITEIILKEKSNHNFTTAFINAISSESTNICQYLFEQKVYINFEQISSSVSQIGSIDVKIFLIVIENVSPSTRYKLMKCINQAIKKKNKKLIEFLLQKMPLPEFALFEAVSTHDLEIVDLILNYNSKPSFVNLKKPEGTALYVAARNKDLDIVKRLFSVKGIEPSAKNEYNESIFTLAVNNYDFDLIEAFFNFYGDDIQYIYFVYEALPRLSDKINGNPDNITIWKIVKKVFENKYIDPNYCDFSTFLYKACLYNKFDIVENLLKLERIDVNKNEIESCNTPLMIAIKNNNIKIAELLIQNSKTDLNLRNFDDESALIIAVKNNQKYIVDLLVNDERFDPIQSKLGFAFFNANPEITKQLSLLSFLDVNYEFEILNDNCYISEEKTALVHSIMINDIEKINFIINHPSFDAYKSDVTRAIFIAAKNNDIEIFRKLFKFIGDINILNQQSESLLFYSIKYLSGTIINEILNNPQFDPIKSQIFESFIQLLANNKNNQLENQRFAAFNLFQNPQNQRYKNIPRWQNQNQWQQFWQSQTNLLNQEILPEKSTIFEIVTKIYEFDKQNSHLINFNKLLPNGQSFFTVLTDCDEIDKVSDFLLDHGADPNMADSKGIFPLLNAIKMKSFKFISSLINSNKIIFSQIGENSTYLHIAALFVDYDAFDLIFNKAKIDINSKDKMNLTPLMIACMVKNVGVINYLFEKDDLDYLYSDKFNHNALTLIRRLTKNEYEDAIKSKDAYYQKIISLISEGNPFCIQFDYHYMNFALGHEFNLHTDIINSCI